MIITEHAKQLIRDNIELIDNNDFTTLYLHLYESTPYNMLIVYGVIGQVTSVFYNSDIDPLKGMDYVPALFLYSNHDLREVTIPDTVTAIHKNAFSLSTIRKISGTKNVTLIDDYVFANLA